MRVANAGGRTRGCAYASLKIEDSSSSEPHEVTAGRRRCEVKARPGEASVGRGTHDGRASNCAAWAESRGLEHLRSCGRDLYVVDIAVLRTEIPVTVRICHGNRVDGRRTVGLAVVQPQHHELVAEDIE